MYINIRVYELRGMFTKIEICRFVLLCTRTSVITNSYSECVRYYMHIFFLEDALKRKQKQLF